VFRSAMLELLQKHPCFCRQRDTESDSDTNVEGRETLENVQKNTGRKTNKETRRESYTERDREGKCESDDRVK
jgi:hypothetical protein